MKHFYIWRIPMPGVETWFNVGAFFFRGGLQFCLYQQVETILISTGPLSLPAAREKN